MGLDVVLVEPGLVTPDTLGVDGQVCRIAHLEAAHLGFRHVGPEPDVLGIDEGQDGHARIGRLSRLEILAQHHPVDG